MMLHRLSVLLLSCLFLSLNIRAQDWEESHIISWKQHQVEATRLVDIDGDGDLDLVYRNGGSVGIQSSRMVYWQENDGYGKFTELHAICEETEDISFWAGEYPILECADMDNDGDMDMVTGVYSSSSSPKLAWCENDGEGEFETHEFPAITSDCRAIVIEDLNSDGLLDILQGFDGGIRYHQNEGNGNFLDAQITLTHGQFDGVRFEAEDLDQDGDLDLILPINNTLQLYLNEGTSYAEPQELLSSPYGAITFLRAVDLNQDGALDFITTSGYNEIKTVQVHWSVSGGTYESELIVEEEEVSFFYALVDVNMDGQDDLLIPHADDMTVKLYTRETENAFASGELLFSYDHAPTEVHVGDMDGDGQEDIVISQFDNHQVLTHFKQGIGQYGEETSTPMSGLNPRDIVSADLDGDGAMDILLAARDSDRIAWFKNLGGGHFSDMRHLFEVEEACAVHASDINEDGIMDIISCSYADEAMRLHVGLGNMTFDTPLFLASVEDGRDIETVDIDGDGDLDILSSSKADHEIFWIPHDGNTGFGSKVLIYEWNFDNVTSPIRVFDFDNDGDMDVLSMDLSNIRWFENYGTGGFDEGPIVTTENGSSDTELVLMDADEDGDMDVLRSTGFLLWVHPNSGSNSYEDAYQIAMDGAGVLDEYVGEIALVDADADGDMDIVCSGSYQPKLLVNMGGGNFEVTVFSTYEPSFCSELVVSDINGDGMMNVLMSVDDAESRVLWFGEELGMPNVLIEDESGEPLIQVYPNPFSTEIRLSLLSEREIAEVRIVDMAGRTVYREIMNGGIMGHEGKVIQLAQLDHGSYIMEIRTIRGERYSFSIVKGD